MERRLSTAKHVLGLIRFRLKLENFESQLFLKYNLRTLNRGKRTPAADFSPPTVADHESFTDQEDDEKSDIDISDDEDEIEAEDNVD